MAKYYPLHVSSIEAETEDCVSITFEVPIENSDHFQFIQGQHLALRATIDGDAISRSYSICSSPDENLLKVAVKKVPGGKFSTYANDKIQIGDKIDVMPPAGHFYTKLQVENAKDYLAVTAGSGITPIISIIKTTLETEPHSSFTLFYGNKNTDSIIFQEELEAIKNSHLGRFSIHHFFTQERVENKLFSGRLNKAKLLDLQKLIDYPEMDEIFICGPEEMMAEASGFFTDLGIDQNKVHLELFTSPVGKLGTSISKKGTQPEIVESTVTIIMDGIQYEFPVKPDASILELANKKGADLPFSCKGGVCSTCKSKIIEGEVAMSTNYALEPEEIEAGYILTCQAHPITKKVVISFDEA